MTKRVPKSQDLLVFDFKHSSVLVARVNPATLEIKDHILIPLDQLNKDLPILSDGVHRAALTWEEGMVFRQLLLPDIPEADLKKVILSELKTKFPFDAEESLIGWDCVFHDRTGDVRQKLYSIFYCDKKTAIARLELVRSLGLEPVSLIPSQSALAVWAGFSRGQEPSQDVLVCDIGYENARILAVSGGRECFSRTVPLGGHSLTEMMTHPLTLGDQKTRPSFEEAEAFKRQQKISDPKNPYNGFFNSYFEKISTEIKRSIDYYDTQKYAHSISKVIFTGGGSCLPGFGENLEKQIGVKVVMACEEGGAAPLILGTILAKEGAFNLLPGEFKRPLLESTKKMSLRIAFMSTGALVLLLILGLIIQMGFLKSQLKALGTEWSEIQRIEQLVTRFASQAPLMRSVLESDIPHAAFLKELGVITPPSILLEEIHFNRQEKKLVIRGVINALSGEMDVKRIAQFAQALAGSGFFEQASLKNTSQEKEGGDFFFEIHCVPKGVA